MLGRHHKRARLFCHGYGRQGRRKANEGKTDQVDDDHPNVVAPLSQTVNNT